jgi:hypothetical protein
MVLRNEGPPGSARKNGEQRRGEVRRNDQAVRLGTEEKTS